MKFSKHVQFFFSDMFTWLRTKIGAWCFVLSVLFLILDTLLPVWRIVPLASSRPYIPLHYNIYLGVDRLGSWYQIFEIPALGLGLFLFHLILVTIAFRKEKLLATMVAVASVVIECLLLVAMALIVLLNLSYAA